jgi:hypothetical protein
MSECRLKAFGCLEAKAGLASPLMRDRPSEPVGSTMAKWKQRLKFVGALRRAGAAEGPCFDSAFIGADRFRPPTGKPAELWRGVHFKKKRVS